MTGSIFAMEATMGKLSRVSPAGGIMLPIKQPKCRHKSPRIFTLKINLQKQLQEESLEVGADLPTVSAHLTS